jgi:hypothetical protein
MSNTYKNIDEAYEAGNEWVKKSDRFEKLDYLMESASIEFRDNLVNEMVQWMGDAEFSAFFEHLRCNWDIKTPQEIDYLMNN